MKTVLFLELFYLLLFENKNIILSEKSLTSLIYQNLDTSWKSKVFSQVYNNSFHNETLLTLIKEEVTKHLRNNIKFDVL